MNYSKKEAYLAALGSDLKVFLRQSFKTIYPGERFQDNWHIDAIIYWLERIMAGESPRSIINLPPRQLKSFMMSVVLPAYILARDPTAKIICISYADDFARTLARDFRRIVKSGWYRRVFPHVRPIKVTENEFVTDAGGFRFATSVNGQLTGRGGDYIIIDDPAKPDDMMSDKVRESTNEWYRSTLLSRLEDKKNSVLIIVMQRLHVNDLTGYVQSSGGFQKLSLPAIAFQDEEIPVSATETYVRLAGEALHEEREGIDSLKSTKDDLGSFLFAAQYQQRPECPDGAIFKREWMQLIGNTSMVEPGGMLLVSVDTAMSTSATADYTAISVIYSCRSGHYVIEAERGRWEYEMLKAKVLAYEKKYSNHQITFIVEEAVTGIALSQYLRQEGMSIFTSHPKGDKTCRAYRAVPLFEAKRVFFLNREGRNSWVELFINELLMFPNGRFDDQVDSLIQALPWAERRVNPTGKIYFMG